MKPLRQIISRRKKALQSASPKSRDRLRYQLRVAQVAAQLRKEGRAA
jgi:ribosomal protein S30